MNFRSSNGMATVFDADAEKAADIDQGDARARVLLQHEIGNLADALVVRSVDILPDQVARADLVGGRRW